MRAPEGFEWLVILFIVLLLFGSKRLPDMARGLGRSLRVLKAEARGLADDDAAAPAPGSTVAAPAEQSTPTAQSADKPAS